MATKIIAFSGSLRKDSYTTKLLTLFNAQAPVGVAFEIVGIGDLPLFNQDLEENLPQVVSDLHKKIESADGVIFATPEYNRSYSPVLKNAIDWGSRPQGKNKWAKKPLALLGCSPYSLGGFGAVNHLRQVVMYVDMRPLQQPEFYLSNFADKLDRNGNLVDQQTKDLIDKVWKALLEEIKNK